MSSICPSTTRLLVIQARLLSCALFLFEMKLISHFLLVRIHIAHFFGPSSMLCADNIARTTLENLNETSTLTLYHTFRKKCGMIRNAGCYARTTYQTRLLVLLVLCLQIKYAHLCSLHLLKRKCAL